MAFNLLHLLGIGSQAGSSAGAEGAQGVIPQGANVDPNTIVVNARNQVPDQQTANSGNGYIPPTDILRGVNNRDQIQENIDAGNNAPQHQGLFHTKGTLRNILGTLGDAFLIQSGHNPMYAPARAQEKAGDALSGFTVDPLAAVERLAQANPAMANQLYASIQQQQLRQAQLQRQQEQDKSMVDYHNAMIANSSRRLDQSGQHYADLKDHYQRSDANSHINATRPRSQPQKRSQTELEYFQQIDKIPDSQRTPGQRAFYNKFTSTGRTRGSGRPPASIPSGNPLSQSTQRKIVRQGNNLFDANTHEYIGPAQ